MVKLTFNESKKDKSGLFHGRFSLESLDTGHGITLGNQFRRILLTDLGSQAISAVRVAGITNEFSTLPGVREDSLAFLLNLKKIIVKSKTNSKNIQFGRLKVQGPMVITADLIELPSDLIILNPEQYITNISTSNIVEMEFKFEYGTGYRLSNQGLSKNDENYYQLDCTFMPVKKVSFKVKYISEPVRSESLILNIWTNGSLSPEEALKSTIQIMMNLFNSIVSGLNNESNDENRSNETLSLSVEPYTNIAIEELQLSVRAYNCLKKAKINTVGDLLEYSPEKLQELKNFGRKSADEVFSTLKNKFGIILK
jgi:DNA-directed RNA polymerase subunit alpha